MLQDFQDAWNGADGRRVPKAAIVGVIGAVIIIAIIAGRMMLDQPPGIVVETASSIIEEADLNPTSSALADEATIYVTGAVKSPGVYTVSAEARINDAVMAAGGLTEDADLEACNLAEPVVDGMHIRISKQGEQAELDDASSTPEAKTQSNGLININTAGSSELQTLPGIGAATSAKIIADRESKGPYSSVDDLTRVSGIGERKLETIRDLICV